MPPEPLPFDRKDFFKERKPSSSDPAGVVPVRCRETPTTPSSHHNNHGSFSYRCGGPGGSSDFRRPFSGHRKQVGGGWHVTTVEPWQDKFCGNDNRENNQSNSAGLASSSQKDRNGGNFRETTASPNDNSQPHSDFVNSWDQLLPKDQHNGGGVGTTGGQRLDNENSLGSSIDWKPLKWIRSGSLSSRGSGFSHSSSSKSIGVDSFDIKIDAQPGNITPLQSPSEDAVPCLTPRTPADDVSSRKKARLGWGEGLAKYEKKKVGPDDIVDKEGGLINGVVDGVGSLEHLLPSPSSQLDKSPSLTGCSECASPATPYSFACSSSPGIEEKASVKSAEVDNDICNPSLPTDGSTFNLENLELTEAVNMTSLLNELLQSDETSTQTCGFVSCTAMDKLQVWKAEISRTLEITESEIDSLENELKLSVYDVGGSSSFPAASCSLPPTEEKSGDSDMCIEKADDSVEEEHTHTGVEDLDPSTSKFVEPITSCDNLTLLSEKDSCCILDIRSENTEAKCSQDDVSHGTVFVGGYVHNKKKDKLHHELLSASNKVEAKEASDVLTNLLLPSSQWCTSSIPTATNDDDLSLIKEGFAMRKRFLKFKERVITLKFRTFQYLWKEDLRLVSVRKFGAKSQRKFESSSRMGFSDYQKHRSSRLPKAPAGNLRLVPIEYAKKLLSDDSQMKVYRNTVKMPSLILDKSNPRFISDNGLVENPVEVEKERSVVNFWTSEEKEIFLEKFCLFGKDLRKIASFLDRKTVADCVEFYYKNHKSEVFEKTKKHPEFAKEGKSFTTNTYLVTSGSGKRWGRETNAASLGGAADVEGGKCLTSRETAAADVLAGICGSISSEGTALSSCITSLVDSTDVYHQNQNQNQERMFGDGYSKRQNDFDFDFDEGETCSDEMNPSSSDWTDEEKSSFLQAVRSYGKDFSMISRCMRTRSREECKVFYSKARKCLGLDSIHSHSHSHSKVGDGDDDGTITCMVDSGSCDKSSSDVKMEVEEDLLYSSDSKQEVVVPECEQIVVNEEEAKQLQDLNSRDSMDLSIVNNNNMELNYGAEKPKPCGVSSIVRKTLSQDDIDTSSISRLSFRKSQRCSSTDGYQHLPKHSLMDCVESSSLSSQSQVVVNNTSLAQKDENHQQQRHGGGGGGDVKLFGQILTKPGSKTNTSVQENGEKRKSSSFNLKFDIDNNDHDTGSGLSEVPLRRSYGFWDGNRIQTTGFPSLPDPSSIMVSGFGNSTSSLKTKTGFQTRQVYSYKNQEPFKGVLVSDPVAAIRMHYAKTEHYNNNGSNGGDDDLYYM